MSPFAFLRLMHIASPAFPVGAFAYSQGLEAAADAGIVNDEPSARRWIVSLLQSNLRSTDVPYLGRFYQAFGANDWSQAIRLCEELHALRGTRELQEEERRLGCALAKALVSLGCEGAAALTAHPKACYVGGFALAGVHFEAPLESVAQAYLFAWSENQVAALLRLAPLGQTSGLRILNAVIEKIPAIAASGLALPKHAIGASSALHLALCARHETQYSRIFRS